MIACSDLDFNFCCSPSATASFDHMVFVPATGTAYIQNVQVIIHDATAFIETRIKEILTHRKRLKMLRKSQFYTKPNLPGIQTRPKSTFNKFNKEANKR